MPFSFADFTLNSFAIIDHSCGYDYMPSPMSPSSQSSNLEVILGFIKQKQKYYQNLVIKKNYQYWKFENIYFEILDFFFCGKPKSLVETCSPWDNPQDLPACYAWEKHIGFLVIHLSWNITFSGHPWLHKVAIQTLFRIFPVVILCRALITMWSFPWWLILYCLSPL